MTAPVFRHVLFLTLLLCQGFSQLYASDKYQLAGDWIFQYTNADNGSSEQLNDRHWSHVEVPGMLNQRHRQARNGWYRLHFKALVSPTTQAILIESIRHSDETWLNGVKIGAQGNFEQQWTFNSTNPQSLSRVYPIPQGLLKPEDNLLAIKVSVGFGEAWGAMYPGGAGIYGRVFIGENAALQTLHQRSLIATSSIDVVFITLALLDVLIILFLLKNALGNFPEFKWLVVCSLLMLLGTSSHDLLYIHQFDLLDSNLLLILTLLFTPVAIACYFWSQHRDLKVEYVQGVALISLFCALILLLPGMPGAVKILSWYVYCLITFACFGYALYCAIQRVAQGHIGSIAQLLALVAYLYSIRTQWMPHESFGHRNIQLGSLFYRYGILFAYFQQMSHLRLDYKNLAQRIVNITEKTRHALARELHDGLGQHLASMKMQIQLQNKAQHSSHTEHVETELKNALINLRRLINGLHPVEIDNFCISQAIEMKCHSLANQYAIDVLFNSATIELSKEMEQHIFRIFQECVANAIKHGKSTKITVDMAVKGSNLSLVIADNGVGFDAKNIPLQKANSGFGYVSIHERIALLNGVVSIDTQIPSGVKITIRLPLVKNHLKK